MELHHDRPLTHIQRHMAGYVVRAGIVGGYRDGGEVAVMKVEIKNPYNFDLDLNLKETEKQGKEIFEFTNSDLQPLHYVIDGVAYYPDRHYLSDLSSIPRPLTIIRGMERFRWKRSALPHDQLYKLGYLYNRQGHKCYFTRPEADELYRLLIIEEGKIMDKVMLARIISPIQWLGLRIGGWMNWRGDDAK